MNMVDASLFAKRVGAKKVVPIHIGMFDELDVNAFECVNEVIPRIYEIIEV